MCWLPFGILIESFRSPDLTPLDVTAPSRHALADLLCWRGPVGAARRGPLNPSGLARQLRSSRRAA
jgi:hypothetical protein